MTKRQKAKYKIDRRLGLNLWGRAKSPFVKRPYRPGQGGSARRRGKLSDFAVQLNAKQAFKAFYDLSETQIKNIVQKADKQKGDTVQNIISILESRLQSFIYWSKFAPTVGAARVLISHGHVLVNGQRVKSRGYLLKPGDVISLTEKAKNFVRILESLQNAERDIPEYISVNESSMTANYARIPLLADVPYPAKMEPNLLKGVA